jgi:hypothetical protein
MQPLYYLIRLHPKGGYAAVPLYHELDTCIVTDKDHRFTSIQWAKFWAEKQEATMAPHLHPECLDREHKGFCSMCVEEFEPGTLLGMIDHLRTIHPEVWGEGVECWPDGEPIIHFDDYDYETLEEVWHDTTSGQPDD